jgi:hypothetical protein
VVIIGSLGQKSSARRNSLTSEKINEILGDEGKLSKCYSEDEFPAMVQDKISLREGIVKAKG